MKELGDMKRDDIFNSELIGDGLPDLGEEIAKINTGEDFVEADDGQEFEEEDCSDGSCHYGGFGF